MNELVRIFETDLGSSDTNDMVLYDDGMSYMQKQSKKPLPPSQKAVKSYFYEEPRSKEYILQTFLQRAVLIGTGIYLLGDRKSLVRNSLVASASIEAYLFYWFGVKHKDKL